MRSKTPLIFMEQLVMVLVFALAATLCVQVFVLSDRKSRRNAAADQAVIEAQNAAEALKSGRETYFEEMSAVSDGDGGYRVSYNEDWQCLDTASGNETGAEYILTVSFEDSGLKYLWSADIEVRTADGDILAALPVSGQKTLEEADNNG